jgi:hypothetical protein
MLRLAPGTWQSELGDALTDAHVDQHAEVLAAAQSLLAAVDPEGTAAGKYAVDSSDVVGLQGEGHTVITGTNYGVVAGTISGQVNISYPQPPNP